MAEFALKKLKVNAEKFGDNMVLPVNGWNPLDYSGFSHNCYKPSNKVTWTTGMWTGLYWLAYQYSCETYGDYFFFEALVRLLKPEIEFC